MHATPVGCPSSVNWKYEDGTACTNCKERVRGTGGGGGGAGGAQRLVHVHKGEEGKQPQLAP